MKDCTLAQSLKIIKTVIYLLCQSSLHYSFQMAMSFKKISLTFVDLYFTIPNCGFKSSALEHTFLRTVILLIFR